MRIAWLLGLAGCNSLFGIPSSGQVIGDGAPGDVSIVGNCQDSPDDCRLAAVDRVIAKEGEAILLEGTFGAEVSVTFAGVRDPIPAMLLGAHRARVDVPVNAAPGAITVTTAGRALGPLPFRGASFALGINHFQVEYAQTTEARAASVLASERAGTAAVAIGDRVHVLGGRTTAGTTLNTGEVARINADGTLSSFTEGPSMVTSRAAHTVTRVGSRVIVVGGVGGATPLASVELAAIGEGEAIGPFGLGPPLTAPRAGHAAVVIGDGLFVIGGTNDLGPNGVGLTSIERAQINPDGTIQPFAVVEGVELLQGRGNAAATVVGDKLYVFGGLATANGVSLDTIERAQINGDGTLGAFELAPVKLRKGRAQPTALVIGDRLVVIGGVANGIPESSIEAATIGAGNELGAPTALPQHLLAGRAGAAVAIAGNYLYLIGGRGSKAGNDDIALTTVEHASLLGDAELGMFADFGDKVTVNNDRTRYTVSAVGPLLVVLGGELLNVMSGLITVIQVDSDSVPGIRIVETTRIAPRSNHRTAAIGDFLYVLGGAVNGGVTTDTTFAASTSAALATFDATKPLDTERSGASAIVFGSKLYVLGGENGTGPLSTVASSSFGGVGTLGNGTKFDVETGSPLTVKRSYHCNAAIGDKVYVLGGTGDQSTTPSTVERSQLNGNTLAIFQAQAATMAARSRVSCAVLGRYLYVIGNDDGSGGTGTTIERAEISPIDFSLSGFSRITSTLPARRQDHRVMELGNAVYVIGGDNAAATPINSMVRAPLR